MFQSLDKRMVLILMVLFALFIVAPVFAQEVTPEPTAPAPDAITITAAQLLAYIVLALAAGGGGLAILYRVLENRNVQDIVEKTYESWNPDTQETIKGVITGLKETNDRLMTFLERVTDGLPNTEPTLSHDQIRSIVRSEMQNVRNPVPQTSVGSPYGVPPVGSE